MSYVTPAQYEIAEKNGLDRKLVYGRVYSSGWEVEEAITLPRGARRAETSWSKWKDLASEHGVCKRTFFSRVNKSKMTPHQAATEPVKARTNVPKWVFDKAKENGIKQHVLSHRIHAYKWSYEDACTIPVGRRGIRVKGRKITNETFSH